MIQKAPNSALGIRFDYKIDNKSDRLLVPINSYFYETFSRQVWYKDSNGKYFNIWSSSDETSSQISSIKDDINSIDVDLKEFNDNSIAYSIALG